MQDDLLPLATRERTLSNQPSPGLRCNQLENISIIVLILVDLRGGWCAPQYIQPMTCRGRHWFKQVSERKRRGNLNGNRIAKSLSIVQCMCDIHPMLPNQCSSAELKNLPGGIIYLPWTIGAKGLLFFSCVALSRLLFVQNKMRLFSALNPLKTNWFCH